MLLQRWGLARLNEIQECIEDEPKELESLQHVHVEKPSVEQIVVQLITKETLAADAVERDQEQRFSTVAQARPKNDRCASTLKLRRQLLECRA